MTPDKKKQIKCLYTPVSNREDSLKNWITVHLPPLVDFVNELAEDAFEWRLDLETKLETLTNISTQGDFSLVGELGQEPLQARLIRPLSMKDEKILDVADPEAETDGANKRFVEQIIKQHFTSEIEKFLKFSMIGDLSISGKLGEGSLQATLTRPFSMKGTKLLDVADPKKDMDGANKRFVESAIKQHFKTETEKFLNLSVAGDLSITGKLGTGSLQATLVRPLSMKGEKILDVADPEKDLDGVNKRFVESSIKQVLTEAQAYADIQKDFAIDFSKTYAETWIENLPLKIQGDVYGEGALKKPITLKFQETSVFNKAIIQDSLILSPGSSIELSDPFDLNHNTIVNLKNPENGQDAVTKSYVDHFFVEVFNKAKEYTKTKIVGANFELKEFFAEKEKFLLSEIAAHTLGKITTELEPLKSFEIRGNISGKGNLLTGEIETHFNSHQTLPSSLFYSFKKDDHTKKNQVNSRYLPQDFKNFSGFFSSYESLENKIEFSIDPENSFKISHVASPVKSSDISTPIVEIKMPKIHEKQGLVIFHTELNLSGKKINNVADPKKPQDVATMAYTDKRYIELEKKIEALERLIKKGQKDG